MNPMNHRTAHAHVLRALVTVLAIAAVASPAQAGARGSDPTGVRIPIGARARVVVAASPAKPIIGTIAAVDADAIKFVTAGGAVVLLTREEIRSLQISVERPRQTFKGTAIGAAVGGALAAVATLKDCSGCSKATAFKLAIPPFALWGAIIGTTRKSDRWTDIRLDATGATPASPNASLAVKGALQLRETSPPSPTGTVSRDSRLFVGARVRVHHDGRRTTGQLVDLSEGRLSVIDAQGTATIEGNAVSKIEVSGGEKRYVLRGALIGAAFGAAVGFVREPTCFVGTGGGDAPAKFCSRGRSAWAATQGTAMTGAIVGFLVRRTKWIPASLSGVSTPGSKQSSDDLTWQVTPTLAGGRGAGLRLRLTW